MQKDSITRSSPLHVSRPLPEEVIFKKRHEDELEGTDSKVDSCVRSGTLVFCYSAMTMCRDLEKNKEDP